MAIPRVRSFQQILGDQIETFLSHSGINDLRAGSALLSILETAAQSDFRTSEDIFAVLDTFSIDRAQNEVLDRIAAENDIKRYTAAPSTGEVTFVDGSLQKIATKIYPGTPAPNIGSTILYVVDASSLPDAGKIYLGRGTQNVEGPLNYSSKVQIGDFWQLNLASGTSRFHNISEGVVLSQGGNRTITAGLVVQTPQGDSSSSIQFTVTSSAVLPDGENVVENIPVLSSQPGTIGNVGRNAISQTVGSPIANLNVSNPLPFVTGVDQESDPDLRERIKLAIQSRGKGTVLAIENSVNNIVALDEPKRVVSSSVFEQPGQPTKLIIDDGSGYEEISQGIGLVSLVDSALGGELFLQLPHRAVAKALLITTFTSPFAIEDGYSLNVIVGGALSSHTFVAADFKSPGTANAFEVVSSINSNSNLLFAAATYDGGKRVRIFAKADSGEDLLIVPPAFGVNANDFLRFLTSEVYSLFLYKNDQLLYKDGIVPTLSSTQQNQWNPAITDGDTITVDVDGTGATLYTFNDNDFVAAATGYTTVSQSNSLASWAAVFNAKIPGITAVVSTGSLVLTSNRGAKDNASLEIIATGAPTDLVTLEMFTAVTGLVSMGKGSDYSFNRNTGQISLVVPLVEGDTITAGSKFTRGYVQTEHLLTGTVSVASDAHFWVLVDGNAQNVPVTIVVAGNSLAVTNPSTDIWRYTLGVSGGFTNVQVGDWIVFWDDSITHLNNQGFWRVSNCGPAFVEVEKGAGTVASYTFSSSIGAVGIAVARSAAPMQKITVASAPSKTLSAVAGEITDQLIGGFASVVSGDKLRLTTLDFGSHGGMMLVTADVSGRKFLFTDGATSNNSVSQIAFVESQTAELSTPLFVNATSVAAPGVEPPVAADTGSPMAGVGPNDLLGFLRQNTTFRYGSNHGNYTQIANILGSVNSLVPKATLHEILTAERVYAALPYDIDSDDSLTIILDQDPINKTFDVSLSRLNEINSIYLPTTTSFSSYDLDRGPTEQLKTTFGDNFKFDNFKIWMKARNLLDPGVINSQVLYRFAQFGPTGNTCKVGYFYPTAPSSAATSVITTGQYLLAKIFLPSGGARSLSHSALTQYNVTVSGGGPYTVTFTHNGTGPSPSFVSGGVLAGDIVTIGGVAFNAANRGTYRITVVSATAISMVRSTTGVPESGIAIGNVADMQIYPLATNSANDIVTYVNANMSSYLSASLTGIGNTGGGLINFSTEGTLGYVSTQYVALLDGENWIATTNLNPALPLVTPELTLKTPLSFSNVNYSLIGEQFRIVPTTAEQFSRYFNVLGTSGVTTLAGLTTALHDSKLQIYTNTLGSAGAVQVTGGLGNSVSAPIIGSGGVVDTNYTKLNIDVTQRFGFHANQFVRVLASSVQPKSLGFDSSTTITITAPFTPGDPYIITCGGSGSFLVARSTVVHASTRYQVDKEGDFVCISVCAGTSPNWTGAGVTEGDWATIGTGFNLANRGVFRVVRQSGDTIWIENPNAVEEVLTTAASATFVAYDSVMIGDTLRIGGSILGAANEGSFPVVEVTSSSQIKVTGTMTPVGPVSLGNSFSQVQILEELPFTAVKRIHTIAVNPSNTTQADVILEGIILPSKMNSMISAYITSMNKFNFDTVVSVGLDGYRRSLGLISEANRVVYGDPLNPGTYPGVKAAGAQLNIEGPLIKRIAISLAVRVRTGVPFSQVEDQIRSNVASTITQIKVGQPVVISDLISAAGSVDGVLAVSVISPTFNSANDLIPVQAYEKPIVVDAESDISVSQIGG